MSINLFFLAAGLGTRLKPLTHFVPKPAVPFLNVPMGFYNLRYIPNSLVKKFIVNTHHLPQQIESLYSKNPFLSKPVHFSSETEKILGQSGALKKAESLLEPDFPIVICNADEVFLAEHHKFIEDAILQHQNHKNLATIVVTENEGVGTKFGGVWTEQNQVKAFGKLKDLQDRIDVSKYKGYHAIGITILSYDILKTIPENQELNIFYDTLLPQLESQKVEVFPVKMDWYETGNPTDYLNHQFEVLKSLGPDLLGFINQYDPSYVIKSDQTLSLVSAKWLKAICHDLGIGFNDPKSTLEKAQIQLQGFNVISKSGETFKSKTIKDSVVFDRYIVNSDYFKN